MKIIKTRKRTEIEIGVLELRILRTSSDPKFRECASEILGLLKEDYPKKNETDFVANGKPCSYKVGVDFAEKDNKVKSYIAEREEFRYKRTDGEYRSELFAPFNFNSLFKSDKEIRKEEREKILKEVLENIEKIGCDSTIFIYNKIKKLIRKET